jgi:hypothetical protein
LKIRVSNKKFYSLDAGFNHAVDSVTAATTYTDHFYPRAGDGRIVVNENINASLELRSVLYHSHFLSSEAGRLPWLFPSMLGWSLHRHRYVADYILCHRGESIQQLVKKYY